MRLYALWICGCLFCCPLDGDVLMTTHMTDNQVEKAKRRFGSDGNLSCKFACGLMIAKWAHNCSKGLFRHLKRRGNATVIWTVNEKEDIEELREQFSPYLDGVMTDIPTTLQEYARDYSGN